MPPDEPTGPNLDGVVAAVNLAAHSSMISLEELVDALGPHLVSTADRISARLGYRRDDEANWMWLKSETPVVPSVTVPGSYRRWRLDGSGSGKSHLVNDPGPRTRSHSR